MIQSGACAISMVMRASLSRFTYLSWLMLLLGRAPALCSSAVLFCSSLPHSAFLVSMRFVISAASLAIRPGKMLHGQGD